MLGYDFGPGHPLKPERLRRAIALLEALGFQPVDPGASEAADVLRVHSDAYVEAVRSLSSGAAQEEGAERRFGFGPGDNPAFLGMYEASLAYVAGSARAAEAVRDGARLAFGLAGGLHHAHRERASGFCIFNDPAIAIHILRERWDRVAYVDIDVHHGDGVQWMYYEDPSVLTCSIHEDPKTLYPGTGRVEEGFEAPRGMNLGEPKAVVNVPLEAGTTGDVWVWAFQHGVLPALERFKPQAIVLQMGTDSHVLDPLAHLRCTAQEWLAGVRIVRDFGVPIVALGGGGYDITCVPRMWAAACLVLAGTEPGSMPEPMGRDWGMPAFLDDREPQPRESGLRAAHRTVAWLDENVLPRLDRLG